ncbi:hypothetical protein FVE85_5972 [Porphyridium purpureum]|uniref:Uncharacterized protein n=1 Tax=Porphyridium purpureum TaxID=35688 RepID=A0A5J4Z6T9_PORPP|nr:hypothetical protein FVE85_5972 [Porphyridium purpureum]|eukprot:POR4302..scf295_1
MDTLRHEHSLSGVTNLTGNREDRPRSDMHAVKFYADFVSPASMEPERSSHTATRDSGTFKFHLPRATSEKSTSSPAGVRKEEIKRTRTNRFISETGTTTSSKNDLSVYLRHSGRKSQSSISADDVEDITTSTIISPVMSLKRLTGSVSPPSAATADFVDVNSIGDFEVTHVEFIPGKSLKERDQSNKFMFSRILSRGKKVTPH